jgi:hypothetical protein
MKMKLVELIITKMVNHISVNRKGSVSSKCNLSESEVYLLDMS